jgi:uncharacterized UPF0160 family protein
MLKITKNIEEANLITHSSTFHPDDVFSTMFLSKIIDNPVVCRVNLGEPEYDNKIVYDIGFGELDHHGPNAKMRNEKIPFCSFGLIWIKYGHDYCKSIAHEDGEALWKAIDDKLIAQIDGIDNGIFPKIDAPYKLTDLDKIIDLFNKAWNEDVDNDDNFLVAVQVAEMIFDRLIVKEMALIEAAKKFAKDLDNLKDGILYLKDYYPYQEALFSSNNPKAKEVKVVIYPSNRGGFCIKPITVSEFSKELAYNFSREFYGLHDDELARVSKIKSARFVHSSGFLACCGTLEDAYLFAENAIKNKE